MGIHIPYDSGGLEGAVRTKMELGAVMTPFHRDSLSRVMPLQFQVGEWSHPQWFFGYCTPCPVEENVFQNLLRDFKGAKRPDGYQEGDFLPPEATEATEASLHVGGSGLRRE